MCRVQVRHEGACLRSPASQEKEMLPTHLLALVQSSATRQPTKARVMSTWLGLGLGLGFGLGLG